MRQLARHVSKRHHLCACLAILAVPLFPNHVHVFHTTFKQEPHALHVITAVKHVMVFSAQIVFPAVPQTIEPPSVAVNVFVKQATTITASILNAFNAAINVVLVWTQQLVPLAIVLSLDRIQGPCALALRGTLRTLPFNVKNVHTTVFNAPMPLLVRFVIPQIEL